MKKYLGIVKIYDKYMSGVNIIIKSRTYDDETLINEWFKLYPGSEHIMLQNTKELDSMFEIFRDTTPLTDEEKQEMGRVKVLYKRLISEEDD